MSHEGARKFCQGQGRLYEPRIKEEYDIIKKFSENFYEYGITGPPAIRIGIDDLKTPGEYVYSSDNSKVTFTDWSVEHSCLEKYSIKSRNNKLIKSPLVL